MQPQVYCSITNTFSTAEIQTKSLFFLSSLLKMSQALINIATVYHLLCQTDLMTLLMYSILTKVRMMVYLRE